MYLPVLAVLCTLVTSGHLKAANTVQKRSSPVCYQRVGCFSTGPPFISLPTRPFNLAPESPNEIKTWFIHFSRPHTKAGYHLDARNPEDFATKWFHYRKGLPLKIIIHGFIDNVYLHHWQNSTKDAFLWEGDYNVVLVDWKGGNFLPYTQATGNTRLVGAQIADLIHTLQWKAGLQPKDVHIIGHSLGAHVAGYAGERVQGLGRITGLDPAGPYFDGTDRAVRLDETDADFVDIIHTDAESVLKLGMGMRESVGHVDFWPNLGHDQPGCDKSPIQHIMELGLLSGTPEIVACSHLRAPKLFIDTIVSNCSFTAYPCNSENDFKNGHCYTCGTEGCSTMGFFSDGHKPKARTNYYLTTADSRPYCQYHMLVTVSMHSELTSERGKLKIQVFGPGGSTDWLELDDSPRYYKGNQHYTFLIGSSVYLGKISAVKLTWDHDSKLLNPFEWNILGLRSPKLYIDQVLVKQESTGEQTRLCANGASIKTDDVEKLSITC